MCVCVHVCGECLNECVPDMHTHTHTRVQARITLKSSSQRGPVVLEEGGSQVTGRQGQRGQGWQTPDDAAQAVCGAAAQWVVAQVHCPQQLHTHIQQSWFVCLFHCLTSS